MHLIDRTLDTLPPVLTYEAEEALPEDESTFMPDGVKIFREDDGAYVCEGEWLEKLVNRVNFDDRESLMYFDRSLRSAGLIDRLRERGCAEGDTVRMYGLEFDFVD